MRRKNRRRKIIKSRSLEFKVSDRKTNPVFNSIFFRIGRMGFNTFNTNIDIFKKHKFSACEKVYLLYILLPIMHIVILINRNTILVFKN